MPVFLYSEEKISTEKIAGDLGLKIINGAYYLDDNHVDHVIPGVFYLGSGEENLLQAVREMGYFKEQIFPSPNTTRSKSR